jgi:hypothetical protein
MALNVVCCETAIRLESGAKRTSLAHAQSVADDPNRNSRPYRTPAAEIAKYYEGGERPEGADALSQI